MKSQVSPRSHERYAEIARRNIAPILGQAKILKLNALQISQAYAKALECGRRDGKGGLSPRTVHHMHRVLKQALADALRWNLLSRDPADAVDPPKVSARPMQTYDLAQTATLIEAMRPTRMFVPTILCGLRRGEIAALRWRSVDLVAGSVAIVESAEQTKAGVRYKEPKSGKTRNVRLSETVVRGIKGLASKAGRGIAAGRCAARWRDLHGDAS
jgi:integrase